MAIQINKQPQKVSWSRNPMIYELESDNRFSAAGSKFMGQIIVADALNGNTFTLTWNGVSHGFSFRTVPDSSGLQLSVKDPSVSSSVFAERMASELRLYYPLINSFDITVSTNVIVFLAKEKGSDSHITYSGSSYPGGTWSQLAAGVSPVMRDNFALLAEIALIRPNGTLESFSKSVIELDEENKAVWDVQEYLTAALLADGGARPDLDEVSIWKEVQSTQRFCLLVAEMYGSTQVIQKLKRTDEVLAVLGGLPSDRMDDRLPYMYMDGSVNKWVSHPGTKRISRYQMDYASIINWGTDKVGDIIVKCRVSYSDERIVVGVLGTVLNWAYGEKLVVPCGLEWIGSVMGDVDGEVVSVDLWCEMDGDRLSTDYSLLLDNRYHMHANILLYQNSLGCWESLYTYGKCEHGYAIERNGAVFEPLVYGSKYDAKKKELDVEIRDEIKINTGFFDRDMIKRFRDFMLSRNKYIYSDGWRPVVGASSSIKEFEDGNYLHGLSFTLEYSNEEVLF